MGFRLGAGIAGSKGHLSEVVPEESMGVNREVDRLLRLSIQVGNITSRSQRDWGSFLR